MLKRNDLVRIFFLASSLSWRATVLADHLTTYPEALMSTETSLVVGGNGTLPSFVSGVLSAFTVTAVSEIGDKTFFIALVLALAHSPAVVYGGALSALALMTVLSASLGLVFSYLSALWVHYLSALLFLLFGLKMLREGEYIRLSLHYLLYRAIYICKYSGEKLQMFFIQLLTSVEIP
ncbi:GDT1 family protein [Trichonephila inaurata madagascariensis]|uniref:GDT1 family protein n=1 Tax=Trichonephila inaurata madagascariensis TaxID=2747483 RepID=A0A8X6X4C4_9ARAC|nr:GDT1 family protein [Trichonephila inaurata madagascariensis]